MTPQLIHVESGPLLDDARKLFTEYAESLNFNLCFQSFDKELRELPGDYGLPGGRLVISYIDGRPAGCVALRTLEPGICEMKRLYVRPEFRGRKLGLELTQYVLREARRAGFSLMRLDTIVGTMDRAIELYRALGFKEIPAYYANPIPTALFMELRISDFRESSESVTDSRLSKQN